MRRPTSDVRQREDRRTSLEATTASGNRRRNSSVPFHHQPQSSRPPDNNKHGGTNSMDSETDFLCDRAVEFMDSGDIHSIVAVELAEQSAYFERLLRYHKGRGYIRLPEFLNPGFVSVLEFIRKGHTQLTHDNVYNVFIAADYLLVPRLKDQCAAFIHQLAHSPSTAINLWLDGRHLNWPEVADMAFQRLLENFESVWKSPEFNDLDPMDVWLLLQDDGLNCRRERSVFDAVQKWINHRQGERVQYARDLLLCIRLGLMSSVEVDRMKSSQLVQSFPDYAALLADWPECLTNSSAIAPSGNQFMIPRIPHEVVLVFGGWCDGEGPKAAAQVYNPRSNTWTLWSDSGPISQTIHYDWLAAAQNGSLPSSSPQPPSPSQTHAEQGLGETLLQQLEVRDGPDQMDIETATISSVLGEIPRRVYAGCCLVGKRVYLVGGFDGSNALKSTLCYDFEIDSGWYEISCMYEKRYYVSVAYAEQHIYAVGGHNGENQGRLDSAERYNLEENLWQTIASMNRIRSDAAAAELQGRVYVAGGFEGRRYHDSVEFYDSEVNQWTLISSMHSPRGGISLAQHNGFLYAIGGNDGNSRLRSIERYDPTTSKWEVVGQMNRRKSNLSSTVLNDDIYIIGGWSDEPESGILSLVERFDTVTRECHLVRPLTFAASATCACTLRDRDMVVKYIRPVPLTSTRDGAPNFAGLSNLDPTQTQQQMQQGNSVQNTNNTCLNWLTDQHRCSSIQGQRNTNNQPSNLSLPTGDRYESEITSDNLMELSTCCSHSSTMTGIESTEVPCDPSSNVIDLCSRHQQVVVAIDEIGRSELTDFDWPGSKINFDQI